MQVTIIGTGLIGCSLGLALKKSGHHITGVDNNPSHLEKALFMGGIDEISSLDDALITAQLVVMCVPVDVVIQLLVPILNKLNEDAVVMDMGSTKGEICRLADSHASRNQFVAVHPMAGVEHSGPLAAHIDLFHQARVIICDAQKSSTTALNVVLGVLQEIRMKVIFMDSSEHDRQLALVSHLPQFIAYALASLESFSDENNKDWVQLGGGGLQSSIRLGKSDAAMWIPVFDQNKEHLLDCIDKYVNQLKHIKELVLQNKRSEMEELIKTANHNYEKLYYRNNTPRPLVPDKGAPKVFYS
jgi:prephenate dehydrogenase